MSQQDNVVDVNLYLASRIDERLAALRRGARTDPARGRRRLQRWQRADFHRDTAFAAWSGRLGLDPAGWERVLGLEPTELAQSYPDPPRWVLDFAEQLRTRASDDDDWEPRMLGPLIALAPLVQHARTEIREGVERLARAAGQPALGASLPAMLDGAPYATLSRIALRVFVLHMHVAAHRGELVGDDPHLRYAGFVARLRDPAFGGLLLRQYPAMVEECRHALRRWREARLEFVEHLLADFPTITGRFEELRPEALRQVVFNYGDAHRGGRGVAILHFDDDRQLVYKPRSLLADERFQALIRWTTSKGFEPGLAPLWVVDRGDHGWMEYAPHRPCADRLEVERYYRRLGGYLALLYLVHARDVHRENIIACGDTPHIVDLEGLFHAEPARVGPIVSEAVLGRRVVVTTALAVGVLPAPVGYVEGGVAGRMDLSGLTGQEQLSAQEVYAWQDRDTDRMRLHRRRVSLPAAQNSVNLAGATTSPAEFCDAFDEGFAAMYRVLLAHRDELAGAGGPVRAFQTATTRVFLRDTQFYNDLLDQTYHPDLLHDTIEREYYISQALESDLGVAGEAAIIDSERQQIAAGDIPIFWTTADGVDLVGGDGTIVAGALATSGLDAALRRVEELSLADLDRQQWVIRAAIAATGVDPTHTTWPARWGVLGPSGSRMPSFLAAAVDVGDLLLEQSIEVHGHRGWLGLQYAPNSEQWQLTAVGPDLYSGRGGIALYLSHLAAMSGLPRFAAAARRLAEDLAERLVVLGDAHERGVTVNLLGMTGAGDGALYALAEWARLGGDEGLVRDAFRAIAPALRAAVTADTHYDLLLGASSTILVLARLPEVCPEPQVREIVTAAADRLVAALLRPSDGGVAWRPDRLDGPPLTGASHGASGIALALAQAGTLLRTDRYGGVVSDALRFERARYDERLPGWPDLRSGADPNGSQAAWCHGAVGIGTVRTGLARLLSDPGVHADLTVALGVTVNHYDKQEQGDRLRLANLSLCHGELGNLNFLATAAALLDDRGLTHRTARLARAVISVIERDGYVCGVPNGLSSPGLMTGHAGIGYGLLRLTDPEQVPDVLTLQAGTPARPH